MPVVFDYRRTLRHGICKDGINMEQKINDVFGACASKANANRNDTLLISSALLGLQNLPNLGGIVRSKKNRARCWKSCGQLPQTRTKLGFRAQSTKISHKAISTR